MTLDIARRSLSFVSRLQTVSLVPKNSVGKSAVNSARQVSSIARASEIQLFQQRLSHDSTTAHSASPIGIMGSNIYLVEDHSV